MVLGVTAIAYETVTSPEGLLPLLTPMSEIARAWRPTSAAVAKTAAGAFCLTASAKGKNGEFSLRSRRICATLWCSSSLIVFITGLSDGNMPRPLRLIRINCPKVFRVQMTLS
jgi:hypothetical protein